MGSWYYNLMGQEIGPLSDIELRQHAANGTLTHDMYVRRSDSSTWVPAEKVKGLFDPPKAARDRSSQGTTLRTAVPVANSVSPSACAPPAHWGTGSGRSILLFAIGAVLLVAAFIMNADYSEKERRQQQLNDSVSDLGFALSGRYESRRVDKPDRTPAYLVGGLGGVSILGGIVTLGSKKK